MPIDTMALSLLRLADFQLIEIKRRYRGNLGNFVLREGLIPTQWVPPTSNSITYSPEEIVDRIRSARPQQSIEDQPISPGASNSETSELPPSIASTSNDRPTTSDQDSGNHGFPADERDGQRKGSKCDQI